MGGLAGLTGRAGRTLALAALALPSLAFGGLEGSHVVSDAGYRGLTPVCRVTVQGRVVALTVDDGPSSGFTPEMIALLGRAGAHATFFLEGARAMGRPDLVRLEIEAGMELGDHTWSHPHFSRLSASEQVTELTRTRDALLAMGLAHVELFRPPFGEIDPAGLRLVRAEGFQTILWSLSLEHYTVGMNLPPAQAARMLALRVRPGDVILAHDAGGDRSTTLETLELLVPALRSQGFDVVTVGELMRRGRPVYARPPTWFWQARLRCPVG
jgi:peptidoglycan/xylan/chitin deacetylase (PgdA/CDA1 family)